MHYRDAKRLRDAGMTVIRSAHYPLDPAFMDACDELGMFVIVATPGWQFFSDDTLFQDRVCDDIRNMVRRDRNRPCIFVWECVLNEVPVSDAFAQRTHDVTHEEYPFPGCFTAADAERGINAEVYDVLYARYDKEFTTDKCYFKREWGDYVDDFSAHNSPSRASRDWGEAAQLVQAHHYANGDYPHDCWQALCNTPRQFIGGCLWHSFDHQRGYHPDPFWGGIMDAFRQTKYAYYIFASQQDPKESGPMVFIANELTPFSGRDVWVFSNCDEVRLTVCGEVVATKPARAKDSGMPHPPVCFEDIFRFSDFKKPPREEQAIIAEGLIDGKVAATSKRVPSRRKSRIQLRLDDCGIPLIADGGDFTMVIAEEVDEQGVVKRLTKDWIHFEVEGEAEIIGDREINANPRLMEWGSAPVQIKSTKTPGAITVKARLAYPGIATATPAELAFASIAADKPFV
jgi:beta-galactosidase